MNSNELTIKVHLDHSQAKVQANQLRQDMRSLSQGILTDAEVAKRAESEMHRRANREKISAVIEAKEATKAAAEEEKKAWGEVNTSVLGGVQSLGQFALGLTGLTSIGAVVTAIVENFREASRSAYDAGQMVQDYRKALLELAALKGQFKSSSETVKEEVAFRAATLQTREDAKKFQETALGVGESSIDKEGMPGKITREEFAKAMKFGGQFQAGEGGDASAQASLIGMIPALSGKGRMTGEEVFQKEQQLYKIFQPGGASFSSMATQFAKLAPLITTGTYTDTEAAALLSAFSVSNKEGAGENVQQFTRATLGGVGKMAGVKVEGAEKQGEYLKGLGVTDQFMKGTKATELPFAIADKIADDLAAQKKESDDKGESFAPLSYMKKHGFGNMEDVNALLSYAGMRGTFKSQFMPLAASGAMPGFDEAMAPVLQKQRTDPAMQGRRAELSDDLAKIATGAGKEEYTTNLYRVAFNRLKSQHQVAGNYDEDLQNRSNLDPRELLFGYRKKTEMEAQKILVAEARRSGVDASIPVEQSRTGDVRQTFMGKDELYKLSGKVNRAGGNSVPGMDLLVRKAQSALDTSLQNEGVSQSAGGGGQANAAGGAGNAGAVDLLKRIADNTAPAATPPRPLVERPPAMTR